MRFFCVAIALAAMALVACNDGEQVFRAPTATVEPTAQQVTLPLQPDQPVLYAIKPDGGDARALFRGRSHLGYALSPDGRTIALDDSGPDDEVLYLLDTTTGEREEIVRADWLNLFSWSPDGSWLILDMIPEPDGSRARYLYSVDGATLTLIREQNDSFSRVRGWAPDSSAVYISGGYGPGSLSRVDIPSLDVVPLDLTFDDIALSPDGEWFAVGLYDREGGGSQGQLGYTIDVMRVDGSERRELVRLGETFVVSGIVWSPEGGRISFAQGTIRDERGFDSGVYVADVETAETIRISDAPEGVDTSAVWAPDGDDLLIRRHVCTQCDGPGSKFLLAAADGSGELTLDGTDRFELSDATWSPDGSRFAYGADALYIGESDGSGERVLADLEVSSYQQLSWSPDGSDIFFVRVPDLDPTLYAAAPDGSKLAIIGDGPAIPSPDGRFTVGFDPDTGELVIAADPGRAGPLGHEALNGLRLPSSEIVWSPDSAWLALMTGEKGSDQVLLWDAKGTGDLRLVETPGRFSAVRWSPDGRRFAYSDRSDLWAVDASSGERELLVNGNYSAFDWSPASDEMAVLDQHSLTIVPLDGEGERRVVMEPPPPQGNPTLRWSPDGDRFAIGDIRSIHVVSAASGEVEMNAASFIEGLAWSVDGSFLAFGAGGTQGGDLAGGIYILEAASGELVKLTQAASRSHVVRGWLDDGRVLFASVFRL